MTVGYHNPYLADSQNPIAHGRCDQQDCTTIAGALPSGGPHAGEALASEDVQHTWLGPGHFGGLISGVYPDGRRVIWSNGRERLVKLDYDTLEVLATLDVGGGEPSTREDWEAGVAGLDDLSGDEAVGHAGAVVLDQHVGIGDQAAQHLLALGRLEIEANAAALSCLEIDMV